MGSLIKYLHLPLRNKRLLIESLLILTVIRISLRLLPYKIISKLITRLDRMIYTNQHTADTLPDDICWAIIRTGQKIYGKDTCLPLALAGQLQLVLHGFPACTRIGVKINSGGGLIAHAWVELNGNVMIGGSELDIHQYTLLSDIEGK
jgi:hypothetical protein